MYVANNRLCSSYRRLIPSTQVQNEQQKEQKKHAGVVYSPFGSRSSKALTVSQHLRGHSGNITHNTQTPATMSLNNADQTTEGRCVSVTLPNLFSDFMAGKESVNPFYREVKPQADAWIAKSVTPPPVPSRFLSLPPGTTICIAVRHVDKSSLGGGNRVLNLDDKTARRNAKADLALLSASWVPSADEAGCRLMADWNHWVFVFDDREYCLPCFLLHTLLCIETKKRSRSINT